MIWVILTSRLFLFLQVHILLITISNIRPLLSLSFSLLFAIPESLSRCFFFFLSSNSVIFYFLSSLFLCVLLWYSKENRTEAKNKTKQYYCDTLSSFFVPLFKIDMQQTNVLSKTMHKLYKYTNIVFLFLLIFL